MGFSLVSLSFQKGFVGFGRVSLSFQKRSVGFCMVLIKFFLNGSMGFGTVLI